MSSTTATKRTSRTTVLVNALPAPAPGGPAGVPARPSRLTPPSRADGPHCDPGPAGLAKAGRPRSSLRPGGPLTM
ncbi:exported hypothetical protein [Frankia sp. AgKG'84/4]